MTESISFAHYLKQIRMVHESMIPEGASEEQILQKLRFPKILVDQLRSQWASLVFEDVHKISDECLSMFPATFCSKYEILPYSGPRDKKVVLICRNPFDPDMREAVENFFEEEDREIEYRLGEGQRVTDLLDAYFRMGVSKSLSPLFDKEVHALTNQEIDDAIDGIILDALKSGATDIHITLSSKTFNYRLRRNKQFFPAVHLPRKVKTLLKNRMLVRAGVGFDSLNTSIDCSVNIPQEDGPEVSARISLILSREGYSIVIRLNQYKKISDVKLQLPNRLMRKMVQRLSARKGLMLVSGPVNSGKTTFYYQLVQDFVERDYKVISIEDPVEYPIPGSFQVDLTKDDIDLRGCIIRVLRQDPDVIMISEARTAEAAKTLSEAGMAGNMTVATIHALSPLECLVKLKNFGCAINEIMSHGIMIITARLYSKACSHCLYETEIEDDQREYLKRFIDVPDNMTWYANHGCSKCNFSGSLGLIPFYTYTEFNEDNWQDIDMVDFSSPANEPFRVFGQLNQFLLDHARNKTMNLKALIGAVEK